MIDSIKSVQAQQIFRVQPINLDDSSDSRSRRTLDTNIFSKGEYGLNRPSVEGNPNLGRSLDLLG